MSIASEFKEFAVKGNVMDMAVGIIVGVAFGKIVTSLVNDVIMPPIGLLLGGVNFSDLVVTLKPAVLASEGAAVVAAVTPSPAVPASQGAVAVAAVTLNYGKFIQTVVDFLIVAIAVFLMLKVVSILRRSVAKGERKAA